MCRDIMVEEEEDTGEAEAGMASVEEAAHEAAEVEAEGVDEGVVAQPVSMLDIPTISDIVTAELLVRVAQQCASTRLALAI